ncbi:MAG: hypothetical protein AAGJ38_03055 [Planctomycetota bacterium]
MSDAIACPGCLKRFAWTPKIAGKRVTCHCGQQFITPEAPGGEVIPIYETSPAAAPKHESDPYDLAEDPPDADPVRGNDGPAKQRSAQNASLAKCPDCNAPLKPNAVVCVRCGFDLSAGSKLRTQVADDAAGDIAGDSEGLVEAGATGSDELARRAALASEPALPVRSKLEDAVAADIAKSQRFRDVLLPIAVLVLGLGLWLFNTLVMAPWNGDAAMWAFGGGGSWADNVWAATKDHIWLIGLIGFLTVVSRLLCASLLGADFGTPIIALLKMAAFTFCFVGLSTLAFYGLNILVEGVFFIVILLWGSAAVAALFVVAYAVWDDLDQTEMGLILAVVGVGFMMIDLLIVPMAWSLLGWT